MNKSSPRRTFKLQYKCIHYTSAWEQRKLGDCGTFHRGERFTAADYVDEGIPCIHYGEIYTSYGDTAYDVFSHLRIDMAKSLRYAHPGDLIIAATSENVEDVCKAVAWLGDCNVAIHDDSYAFAHDGDPVFYSSLFKTKHFYDQKAQAAYGVKVMRVGSVALERMSVSVPSLAEQRAIGRFFSRLDALITLHQRKRQKPFDGVEAGGASVPSAEGRAVKQTPAVFVGEMRATASRQSTAAGRPQLQDAVSEADWGSVTARNAPPTAQHRAQRDTLHQRR
ncbi:restriction endonuclease subunit S [Bifidobacterium simiiventris]|uniref:restriction endonuclease subunit S n=1 Tax=Bifidobacterium simiiventris TaxID=2834434 RepID=UPI001C5A3FDA|nr:restriction endonuclease subunit S [Bifidobacterium simiiventris]MBW3077876.1 restriction endonuclease subunit S [Bifidobacterium simiiventris]